MISYKELVPGKEYHVQTHDTHIYFKGMIFVDYQIVIEHAVTLDYAKINMNFQRTTRHIFFETDYYYDPEKIRENAQHAKENMERRSLDIILKRLINEEFQWL
jgi:hypothetical protein